MSPSKLLIVVIAKPEKFETGLPICPTIWRKPHVASSSQFFHGAIDDRAYVFLLLLLPNGGPINFEGSLRSHASPDTPSARVGVRRGIERGKTGVYEY